jgi:hypothetical protein
MAGAITRSRGTDPHRLRVFGQYAIVLLLHGGGMFRDALGFRTQVRTGDLIFIFPRLRIATARFPAATGTKSTSPLMAPYSICGAMSDCSIRHGLSLP